MLVLAALSSWIVNEQNIGINPVAARWMPRNSLRTNVPTLKEGNENAHYRTSVVIGHKPLSLARNDAMHCEQLFFHVICTV